ncbi:hypothetical protein L596_003791 [Steinernema carpocapsae]|uniref:Uncharacterized protein n=1 Tax=Steinernema carpocapsae TaxID=34508 RepID=A0A4U8UVC9_STECR|nr:hypothetical protein L596_003791 [Steinernema carpocapsae]
MVHVATSLTAGRRSACNRRNRSTQACTNQFREFQIIATTREERWFRSAHMQTVFAVLNNTLRRAVHDFNVFADHVHFEKKFFSAHAKRKSR